MKEKFISILLSISMITTLISASALAEEVPETEPAIESSYEEIERDENDGEKLKLAGIMMVPFAGITDEVSSLEELQAAINGASGNLNIKLSDAYTTQIGTIRISDDKSIDITIDLNGKKLDGGSDLAIEHSGSGTLTITDSGTGGLVSTSGNSTTQLKIILPVL